MSFTIYFLPARHRDIGHSEPTYLAGTVMLDRFPFSPPTFRSGLGAVISKKPTYLLGTVMFDKFPFSPPTFRSGRGAVISKKPTYLLGTVMFDKFPFSPPTLRSGFSSFGRVERART